MTEGPQFFVSKWDTIFCDLPGAHTNVPPPKKSCSYNILNGISLFGVGTAFFKLFQLIIITSGGDLDISKNSRCSRSWETTSLYTFTNPMTMTCQCLLIEYHYATAIPFTEPNKADHSWSHWNRIVSQVLKRLILWQFLTTENRRSGGFAGVYQ